MLIRPAGCDDVDGVLALLNEAAGWLRRRGIAQWPDSFARDWVAPAVADGEVHVAVVDGAPAGTFALTWSDPVMWGDRPDHGDAGYVHQLAVGRAFAGRGIGASLLDHAGRLTAATGRAFVRLDCVAHNRELRAYYERQGFAYVDDRVDLPRSEPAWRRASRYQRPAACTLRGRVLNSP